MNQKTHSVMTQPKQLSYYLYFFSFLFHLINNQWTCKRKWLKRDVWDFINRGKYRVCISSVQQLNGNSIEFSLSTQTWSVIKSCQTRSLYIPSFHSQCQTPLLETKMGKKTTQTILCQCTGYIWNVLSPSSRTQHNWHKWAPLCKGTLGLQSYQ